MTRLASPMRVPLLVSILATTLAAIVAPAWAVTRPPASRVARALPGTPVPRGFVGVDADGPLFAPGVNVAHQFDVMVASGVESVRVAFNWAAAQPYPSWSQVPPGANGFHNGVGNVPTSFAATDEIVGLAAQRGLTVLPTVLYAPGWDAGRNRSGGLAPPARTAPYANYLTALIDRYGPHGSFWAENPSIRRLPIGMWQIWNEPNLPAYWPQPFARSYVTLLRASHAAIKRADPHAEVVTAAITNAAWKYLDQLYRIPGTRHLFDVVAVNGFTSTPTREIGFIQLVRRSLDRNGDPHKPILATEVSWPSSLGKASDRFDWDTTEAGQARNIAAVLPMLAANRKTLGLRGFYYYTWIGAEARGADEFNFAGLLRYESSGRIVAKPALGAFRRWSLAIEGCRRKGDLATSCLR